MSQHRYKLRRGDHKISVLAGWDRPLQYLFLVIDKELVLPDNLDSLPEADQTSWLERLEKESEMLYNNLLKPVWSVDQIERILKGHNLPVPDGFLQAIRRDRQNNAGNLVVDYTVEDVA